MRRWLEDALFSVGMTVRIVFRLVTRGTIVNDQVQRAIDEQKQPAKQTTHRKPATTDSVQAFESEDGWQCRPVKAYGSKLVCKCSQGHGGYVLNRLVSIMEAKDKKAFVEAWEALTDDTVELVDEDGDKVSRNVMHPTGGIPYN